MEDRSCSKGEVESKGLDRGRSSRDDESRLMKRGEFMMMLFLSFSFFSPFSFWLRFCITRKYYF